MPPPGADVLPKRYSTDDNGSPDLTHGRDLPSSPQVIVVDRVKIILDDFGNDFNW
jgi:hypothetical protein